jgi:hypothetical protein
MEMAQHGKRMGQLSSVGPAGAFAWAGDIFEIISVRFTDGAVDNRDRKSR